MTQTWIQRAKALDVGQSKRFVCCGNDADAIISRDQTGVRLYCFKCKANLYEKVDLSPIELWKLTQGARAELVHGQTVELPDGCTDDFPPAAIVWLAKSGVRPELALEYGFKYSSVSQRVIIPVRHPLTDELLGIQSRALYPWQEPKYLNTKGMSAGPALFFAPSTFTGDTIVLTEDALSAIRVGYTTPAAALFGTSLPLAKLNILLALGVERVIIWLDGDKAGRDGRLKITKCLRSVGIHVDRVRSPCDPKTYTNEDIARWIANCS